MYKRVSLHAIGLAATVALLTGCNGGAGSGAVPATQSARVKTSSFAPQGGLDCNGYSAVQKTLKPVLICTDPTFGHKRAYDNGWYIGHDEPSIGFYSNASGSGNN